MARIEHLLVKNREWAKSVLSEDPDFFARLAEQQSPKYLWIGCSDSRVPANQIVGVMPGELFVHRNIANVVAHADLNCLSVLQFAVDLLRVEDIIVCGHYGCSGVRAALFEQSVGLADNWLWHIKEVRHKYAAELQNVVDDRERHNRLCELNVVEQVDNVCNTSVVRAAWQRGQDLAVHGWIYGVHDGLLHDLKVSLAQGARCA